MRVQLAITCLGLCLLGGAGGPISAHYSFAAEFDANKPVKFTATVTKMEWINPHVWIHINVATPAGTVEDWKFEAGSVNTLFRRGLKKDSLPVGTQIVVDGYQARDGSRRANASEITYPDGRKLFVGSVGTGAPHEIPPPAARLPVRGGVK